MASINLRQPVSHITQQDENYCWACAFAMVLGRHSWDAALEIADRCPPNTRDAETGRILNVAAAARSIGLAIRATPREFSPDTLAQRLRRSAVAVFGQYNSGGHVMVVTLLRGDVENPETLVVGVHDPWANGSVWTGRWNRWYGPGRTLRKPQWLVNR